MSPLKIGDKVRTATALTASHWTQNQLASRRPGAEGTIVLVQVAPHPGMYVACKQCIEHGCYIVEHTPGNRAHYHGDELTLIQKPEAAALQGQLICPKCSQDMIARTIGQELIALVCCGCGWKGASLWLDPVPACQAEPEPEPDDEPDGGCLGERVDALAAGVERLEQQLRGINERLGAAGQTGLSGQLDALRGRVAALEHPPAPADPEAVEKARIFTECVTPETRGKIIGWVRNGRWRRPGEGYCHTAADALEAVPDLVRALNKRLSPEPVDPSAAVDAAEQLGVAPVHDDSSLDPPRPAARCERCGGRPEQHPGEPTCRRLLLLWKRLNESGAYTVSDPAALAEAALRDRETVRLQMRELTATKLQYGAMGDELAGIRQQLLDAVDGEPDATTDDLLARVLRRAGVVQHLIMTRDPRLLRKTADGLLDFAGEDGLAATVAGLIREAAAIAEEEQD